MEAPEKIYIPTAGDEMHYHMACSNNEFKESIEYVRNDAFIEKACEWIADNLYDHYDGNDEFGVCSGFVKSEEFIENFKKAMKL